MQIISLGAGVQSSAMLVMSLLGDLPPADTAIFCDTQLETADTYRYLTFLKSFAAERNFTVHHVTKSNILEDALSNKNFISIPFFLDRADGKRGMAFRQCTTEYKIKPWLAKCRELLGLKRYQHIKGQHIWKHLGISTDEAHRQSDSREKWVTNVYPLIDAGLSRTDCIEYMRSKGLPLPPRSACIFCPLHADAYWAEIKRDQPAEFARVCEFEKALSDKRAHLYNAHGIYFHKSLRPLSTIDFGSAPSTLAQYECDGICGT